MLDLDQHNTMSNPPTPSSATAFVNPFNPPSAPLAPSRRASPPAHTEPGPSRPTRTYRAHLGCSLCTVVNYPARQQGIGLGRQVHRDEQVVVLEADEKARAASGGHLVAVINDHAESIYDLGPADVPLLSHIASLAPKLLPEADTRKLRIGFITQFKDSFFPTGHLHAHILSGPLDKASFWRRTMPYGPLSWYELEDLIAEIRESTSNNRIKSGYGDSRRSAPISHVPDAGSVSGKPNIETTREESAALPVQGADFTSVSLTDDARAIERPESSMGLLAGRYGDLGEGLGKGKGKGRDYGV